MFTVYCKSRYQEFQSPVVFFLFFVFVSSADFEFS